MRTTRGVATAADDVVSSVNIGSPTSPIPAPELCSQPELLRGTGSAIDPPPTSKSVPSPPPPEVRSLRVPVTPSPLPLRGAGCHELLGMIGSSASAAAHLPAPPRASTKTRRRRCAKPKCWASSIRHAAHRVGPSTTPALGHPSSGSGMAAPRPHSPPKKDPKALSLVLRTPGTFSQRIQAGSLPAVDRIWSIASARSTN